MQPISVIRPIAAVAAGSRFSASLADTVDGMTIELVSDPARLPVGHSPNVPFSVKDTARGAPISDLEPYLGAMARLMLVYQDRITLVHSHPVQSDPPNGHKGSLTFLARFPKRGVYRCWLQTERVGRVETAAFP